MSWNIKSSSMIKIQIARAWDIGTMRLFVEANSRNYLFFISMKIIDVKIKFLKYL